MNRLQECRQKANLSQMGLAVKAGLCVSAITQLESGRRKRPRPSTKKAIADALGVPENAIWATE